jgi:signal transduction histidine kinase
MKKDERKGRLSLTLLIAVLVFAIQLFSVVVAIAIIAILMKTGIINELSEELLSLRNALFLMSAISLLAGALLATFSGKLYLRPVNRLINYMNRLASGDFKARIQFGKPIASHPAFQEIETSCNKMAEELERTEMLRSDFINNFSHEFKTPIVSIAGFAKLLKRGNLSPEQQQEYLEIIERESLRLSAMATNVLDMTKVENQSILTDVTRFNLSEQLRSCVLMLLEGKWKSKAIDFSVEFEEHMIMGD